MISGGIDANFLKKLFKEKIKSQNFLSKKLFKRKLSCLNPGNTRSEIW